MEEAPKNETGTVEHMEVVEAEENKMNAEKNPEGNHDTSGEDNAGNSTTTEN